MNPREFEAWLDKKKPPKDICVALAARAAIRALPFVASNRFPHTPEGVRRFADLVAPVFRASALARVAATYPIRANDHPRFPSYLAVTGPAPSAARAAYSAAWAAYAAASAATAGAAAAAAYAAADAARSAAFAAADIAPSAAQFSEALSEDLLTVEWGVSSRDLADRPLWPDAEPPPIVAEFWRDLAGRLPQDDGWRVWTRWYDARLKGESWSEEREVIYATVPEEKWNEGPAAANAWIAERLIPAQSPIGSQFDREEGRPIDILPDPPSSEPANESEQRETYEEMQFLARELVTLGPNVLGPLAAAAERLAESLQSEYVEASIRKIYFRGNYLREKLEAHDIAKSERESAKDPDPFPSAAELPHAVIAPLRSFVAAQNVFLKGDATAQKLEALGASPEAREPTQEALKDIAPVVDDIPPAVATEEARTTLGEQVEAGANAPDNDLGDKDRMVAKESTLNFVLEAVRSGTGALAKGGIGAVGKKLVEDKWTEIVDFVRRNSDELISFAKKVIPHSDKLQQLIDAIKDLLP